MCILIKQDLFQTNIFVSSAALTIPIVEVGPRTTIVLGRKVTFKKTCGRILDASFADLCMQVNL